MNLVNVKQREFYEPKEEDIFNLNKYYSINNEEFEIYKLDKSKYFLRRIKLQTINYSKRIIVIDGQLTNNTLPIRMSFLKFNKEIHYLKIKNCSLLELERDINFRLPNLKVLVLDNCSIVNLDKWSLGVDSLVFLNCRFMNNEKLRIDYVRNLLVENCTGCTGDSFINPTLELLVYNNLRSSIKVSRVTRECKYLKKVIIENEYGSTYENSVIYDMTGSLKYLKFTDKYGDFDLFYGIKNCIHLKYLELNTVNIIGIELISNLVDLKTLKIQVDEKILKNIVISVLHSITTLNHFEINNTLIIYKGNVNKSIFIRYNKEEIVDRTRALELILRHCSNIYKRTLTDRQYLTLRACKSLIKSISNKDTNFITILDLNEEDIIQIRLIKNNIGDIFPDDLDSNIKNKIGILKTYFNGIFN